MTTFFESNRRAILTVIYVAAGILLVLWLAPIIGDKTPARWVQTTITGLLVGGIYSLIALGIVVIDKASGVFNFAHGNMMLLGSLIFFSFFSTGQISPLAAGFLAALTSIMVVIMPGWRAILNVRQLAMVVVATLILTALMTAGGPGLRLIHAIAGSAHERGAAGIGD